MPYRPIPTTCWIKFLIAHGWNQTGHVKGSHFNYSKKGTIRSIPVRESYKEVPPLHVQTSSKTMGLTMKYIYDWIENNC